MQTTPKHLMEQRDRFNQRLTLDLELENGERAKPEAYLRGLLRTQSLEAWNGHQEDFAAWIRKSMDDYFARVQVRIYGHSN